jgi:iron(III) transport system permease protein
MLTRLRGGRQLTPLNLTLIASAIGITLVPLLVLVLASLRPRYALPFESSGFTLDSYQLVLRPSTARLLGHSVVYATLSAGLALVLGTVLAWMSDRTTLSGRAARHVAISVCMGLPSLVIAYGWVLLADPRVGVLNGLIRSATNSDAATGPLNVYSLPGMVFVTGLALTPTVYMMMHGVFGRLDSGLDEAATTAGARRAETFRAVHLPLARPGLGSAAIYGILTVFQTFEIPLILGLNADFPVLSIAIFLQTNSDPLPPSYSIAAAYAMISIIASVALMYYYRRTVRQAERFMVVSGRGYKVARVKLRKGGALFGNVLFGGFIALTLAVPFLALFRQSLLPPYAADVTLDAGEWKILSADAYAYLFQHPKVTEAALHTVTVIAVAATVTVLLATVIAWRATQGDRTGRALDLAAFVTIGFPGIAIALAVLLIFVRTPLHGSIWVIAIGFVITGIGFATRLMSPAIMQIDRKLDEAARMGGASSGERLRFIILPLVLSPALNGWVWLAAHQLRDFTFPLMLSSPDNLVLSSLLWQFMRQSDTAPMAAALSILLILITGLIALAFAAKTTKVGHD